LGDCIAAALDKISWLLIQIFGRRAVALLFGKLGETGHRLGIWPVILEHSALAAARWGSSRLHQYIPLLSL